MNADSDQPNDSAGTPKDAFGSQPNPYAAPILDQASAFAGNLDHGVDVDHTQIVSRAKLFIGIGLVLVIGLCASVYLGGIAMAGLMALLQMAWVYPALRLSSRHARDLPSGLRIGLRLVLVLHIFVLALEMAALLFLVTCIAMFTTAGN